LWQTDHSPATTKKRRQKEKKRFTGQYSKQKPSPGKCRKKEKNSSGNQTGLSSCTSKSGGTDNCGGKENQRGEERTTNAAPGEAQGPPKLPVLKPGSGRLQNKEKKKKLSGSTTRGEPVEKNTRVNPTQGRSNIRRIGFGGGPRLEPGAHSGKGYDGLLNNRLAGRRLHEGKKK